MIIIDIFSDFLTGHPIFIAVVSFVILSTLLFGWLWGAQSAEDTSSLKGRRISRIGSNIMPHGLFVLVFGPYAWLFFTNVWFHKHVAETTPFDLLVLTLSVTAAGWIPGWTVAWLTYKKRTRQSDRIVNPNSSGS